MDDKPTSKSGKRELGIYLTGLFSVLVLATMYSIFTDHKNAGALVDLSIGLGIPTLGSAVTCFGMHWHGTQSKWRDRGSYGGEYDQEYG